MSRKSGGKANFRFKTNFRMKANICHGLDCGEAAFNILASIMKPRSFFFTFFDCRKKVMPAAAKKSCKSK